MFQANYNSNNSSAATLTQEKGSEKQSAQIYSVSLKQKPKKDSLKALKEFRIEFGPSSRDILHFTNQLAIMVRAGISIQESLESIADQQKNQKFKEIITDLKNQIEAGQSFSQALSEHSNVFSNIYINMVAAAEVSGSLSDMLQKLAEYLDSDIETRSQVKGAMIYPAIIAFMAVSVYPGLQRYCWEPVILSVPNGTS